MSKPVRIDFIKLPDYFSLLLRSNMQVSGRAFSNLKATIWDNKGFLSIVSRTFSEIDPDLKLEKIINSLGWLGFRDKLASQFVHFQEHGAWGNNRDLLNINDILDFEERLKPYTVEGYSRSFLLAFFIKMAFINSQSEERRIFENFVFDEECLDLLTQGKSRIIQIDWVLIGLHHFQNYLGTSILKSHLGEGSSYSALYSQLNNNQQYEMTSNLLSYSASIGEFDTFFAKNI